MHDGLGIIRFSLVVLLLLLFCYFGNAVCWEQYAHTIIDNDIKRNGFFVCIRWMWNEAQHSSVCHFLEPQKKKKKKKIGRFIVTEWTTHARLFHVCVCVYVMRRLMRVTWHCKDLLYFQLFYKCFGIVPLKSTLKLCAKAGHSKQLDKMYRNHNQFWGRLTQ